MLGVSPVVRRGNAVSAIDGAARQVCRQAPHLAGRVRQVAQDAVQALDGADAHTGALAGPGFRRRSCCQLYRANGALCPDCVLG